MRAEQAELLARELDRVSDRLRVLGPRLAEPGRVRAALQSLADLAADAERRPRREVPELSGYALADQLLVLGQDVLATGDESALAAAAERLVTLRRAL